MRKNNFYFIPAFILAAFALLSVDTARAQGDLMVIPTRVVLESSKRFETLTVLNRGTDSAQYTISFIQYRMTEKGELQEITVAEAGANIASEIVRFFPKQVFLAPGESQTVRVQVSKPEGLANGEYRSHLYFRNVPKDERSASTGSDTSALSVRLTPVFGVSVPVIVRHGELTATAKISSPRVVETPTSKQLQFVLERDGNRSVYGDITMELRSANGEKTSVGGIKGVSVYTPISKREVALPINIGPNDKGTLIVTYKQKVDGRETILAETELNIP